MKEVFIRLENLLTQHQDPLYRITMSRNAKNSFPDIPQVRNVTPHPSSSQPAHE